MKVAAIQKYLYAIALTSTIFIGCQGKYRHGKLGRDTVAIKSLATIAQKEHEFKSIESRFGTLQELADKGLIPDEYASGKVLSGYIYSSAEASSNTYCIQATRESGDAGYGDYNVTEAGEIYGERGNVVNTVKRGEGSLLSDLAGY